MNRMFVFLTMFLAVFLSACVGNPPSPKQIADYDLADRGGTGVEPAIPLASLQVRAAAWLDSPLQAYRLAYADNFRRLSYAESRWVAPPAQLLERFLQRRMVFGQTAALAPNAGLNAVSGCRLSIMLDELEQRFETAQNSQTVLEIRATLQPGHNANILSKRRFLVQQPATTPDAHGGVMATRLAVQTLTDELTQWLGELAHEHPDVIVACRMKAGQSW